MAKTSRPSKNCCAMQTFKVTADTYTQAVTPVKRDAQAKIAKLIDGRSRSKARHADNPIAYWTLMDPDSKGGFRVSSLECWRPRRKNFEPDCQGQSIRAEVQN